MVASGYSVRENTGNSAHPSIDEVVDLALERGINPRPLIIQIIILISILAMQLTNLVKKTLQTASI